MKEFREQEDWAIENLKNCLNQFLDNDIGSKYLAHYCSALSAISIIQEGIAYFSPADTMNDHSEFHFLFDKVIRNLNLELVENEVSNSEFIVELINHLIKNKNVQLHNSFVFCLSEANNPKQVDNLSMWRAYASDGEGCALIFDKAKLMQENGTGQFPISAWKVRYWDSNTAELEANKIAKSIIRTLSNIDHDIFYNNIEGIKSYLTARITDLCFISKHDGFEEEKEVRLIYRYEYDLEPKTFRACAKIIGGQVNARLQVNLKKYDEYNIDIGLSGILHSVMAGPSPNQLQIRKSLILALQDIGLNVDSEMLLSSRTPYRPNRR